MREIEKAKLWNNEWRVKTPESEIRMWDFYGLRPWVLKFTPRFGKVVDAGCGLGRYVFYLNELGVDCIGLDSSQEAISKIHDYQIENGLDSKFCRADVKLLPFKDNSLSGYISLGVIEHFEEGPHKALQEVYRILRPGGVAIISTPSLSFSQVYLKTKRKIKFTLKSLIKKIMKIPVSKQKFTQYWYPPNRLRNFIKNAGLKVVVAKGSDLLYSFYELGFIPKKDGLFIKSISRLENTFLANIGAQSITISYKPGYRMYCSLCGNLNVEGRKRVLIS